MCKQILRNIARSPGRYFVIFAALIFTYSIYIALTSDDKISDTLSLMTAFASILLALISAASMEENRKMRDEIIRDRRLSAIKSSLDEFYSLVLTNEDVFTNLGKQWVRYIEKSARGSTIQLIDQIYRKSYLAEPVIRQNIKKWFDISSELMNPFTDPQRREQIVNHEYIQIGPFILDHAKRDYDKLLEEYNSLIAK